MNRRRWLRAIAGTSATYVLSWVARPLLAGPMQADLEETLNFGLKCRRPVEFAFVDAVVQKVNMGQLPYDLVVSQMRWAQEKNAKVPFPYFEFGMRKRAAALGVDL
jgi:hypothetical protein